MPRKIISMSFSDRMDTSHHDVELQRAIIAGWTGRDAAAVERHIHELEALGVARPASIPTFYRVGVARFTTDQVIEVSGTQSGGEVEFTLLMSGGRLWVGVASDHTDREVERYNVTVSKQMCDKPMAPELWSYEDVTAHWDELILRSFVIEDGHRTIYQEGTVSAMRHPDALMQLLDGGTLGDSTIMLCGTLAARGGVRPTSYFEFEIEDPILKRKIRHAYQTISLPMLG